MAAKVGEDGFGKCAVGVQSAPGQGGVRGESPISHAAGEYPRTFTGRQLKTIPFPLGGIGTGSISLGERGQLRGWEIFNRPDKGNSPQYAFPSIGTERPNQVPQKVAGCADGWVGWVAALALLLA